MRTIRANVVMMAFLVLVISTHPVYGLLRHRKEGPRNFTSQSYPKYNPWLKSLSEGICNKTFHDYEVSFKAPVGSLDSLKLLGSCYEHESCLWDSLTTDQQINFQTAGIVLGIMPTLMSWIGVSIAETALLSAHRPVLSFLLSLGAPAIRPTRVFEYSNPAELLATGPGKLELPGLSPWRAGLLSALEYTVAVAAVVNIFHLSWDMGNKTILSWGCTNVVGPLLWTSLAVILHVLSALSYNVVVWRLRKEYVECKREEALWRRLRSVLRGELTACANHEVPIQVTPVEREGIPKFAVILNIIASGASFIHLAFGTITFSSLIFVSVWDVLNCILWRFIISTCVVRLVLIIEVAGLRALNTGACV